MAKLIKVREVSLRYDISTRALKYYEDMGLIQSSKSEDYAYRLYDQAAIIRLEQILILRKLDIRVKDIQRIFQTESAELLLEVLAKKVTDVEHEVALLNELKGIVLEFIKAIDQVDFHNSGDVKLLYEKAKGIEQRIASVEDGGSTPNVNRLLEVTEKLNRLPDIRVIHIPRMKMISSGPLEDMQRFEAFDQWWSAIDTAGHITPRDFMYFDPQLNCMIWLFAPPENFINTSTYPWVDFPGGLYAVCAARDGDGVDMDKTKDAMRRWIRESGCFEESAPSNDTCTRYELGHVCTPEIFKQRMGYHLMDLFIPIVVTDTLHS